MRRQPWVFLVALLSIAGVAWIDYATGPFIRVFPLYFSAITFAGWKISRNAAFVAAGGSTIAWGVANAIESVPGLAGWITSFNIVAQLVAFLAAALAVSEVRRRLDAERALSRTDTLTGLANSRGFFDHSEIALSLALRKRWPVTFAYVDLDNFKKVNDQHGHAAGDEALKLVARVMRQNTRGSDVLGRLGGDELAIMLPDTDAQGARIVLERIREGVAAEMQERGWPVTTSIGAVAFETVPPLEEAVRAADDLMYEVKKAGKNRVEVLAGPLEVHDVDQDRRREQQRA